VDGIAIMHPTNLDELAREEAEYHDHSPEASDAHRLDYPRNEYFHARIAEAIYAGVPQEEILLEIGAGEGYDARRLVNNYRLVLTDVSPGALKRIGENLQHENILGLIAATGDRLPFVNNSFAGVYMAATWHHFTDAELAFGEFMRVLRPGGRLVIGVEPNAFWFRLVKKFRRLLCRATHADPGEGSRADAEMEGFSHSYLRSLRSRSDVRSVKIYPMWFLTGFWHYGLEFIHRVLKRKTRVNIPKFLDWPFLAVDQILFCIPFFNRLCWHWGVVVEKNIKL